MRYVIIWNSHMVWLDFHIHFAVLKPTAGFQMFVRLAVQGIPIRNATYARPGRQRPFFNRPERVAIGVLLTIQCTHMDEVKMIFWPCPIEKAVVNLEMNIRWHPRWLNRTQVRPYHICARKHVPKIASNFVSASRVATNGGLDGLSGTHIAQIPVPVPTSRTRCGSSPMGARKSLSPMTIMRQLWSKSKPSFCWSSFGAQYSDVFAALYVLPWIFR